MVICPVSILDGKQGTASDAPSSYSGVRREDALALKRSDTPFFEDRDCKRTISELGHASNLAVYTGAGLTIDRSQHNWAALVTALLSYVGLSQPTIEQLGRLYTLDQLASIALQKLEVQYAERWPTEVENVLNGMLYHTGTWTSGRASHNLAQLASQFNDTAKSLSILTTNYDTFFEFELNAVLPQADISILSHIEDVDESLLEEPAEDVPPSNVSLVYLHGIIPDRAIPAWRNRPSYIVLSERQYLDTADVVHDYLSATVRDCPMLIIGSSLIDRPLLRALSEVTRGKETPRYALISNSGLPLGDQAQLREIQSAIRARLRQFDVEPLYPDYYGQVGQFLTEVRVSSKYHDELGPYDAADSTHSYGARLGSWWNAWWSERSKDQVAAQNTDHQAMKALTDQVRDQLEARWLKCKVELWVRWDPEHDRSLKLWATSSGPWLDKDTMLTSPIEHGSRMLATQAFCAGRPLLGPRLDTERWRRYLALPIHYQHPRGEIPVGVLNVAVMAGPEDESLSEVNTAGLNKLRLALTKGGTDVLAPAEEIT